MLLWSLCVCWFLPVVRGAAAATRLWDRQLLCPVLLGCLLLQQFSQVNTSNWERQILISHEYLFILAEGGKVIYVCSCLQQVMQHQEANKVGIKRVKCICLHSVAWMQSLTALVQLVLWHRGERSSSSHSSQSLPLPEGCKGVVEGSGWELLPFSVVSPLQNWEVCSSAGAVFWKAACLNFSAL